MKYLSIGIIFFLSSCDPGFRITFINSSDNNVVYVTYNIDSFARYFKTDTNFVRTHVLNDKNVYSYNGSYRTYQLLPKEEAIYESGTGVSKRIMHFPAGARFFFIHGINCLDTLFITDMESIKNRINITGKINKSYHIDVTPTRCKN
jgi:hypothetical protein